MQSIESYAAMTDNEEGKEIAILYQLFPEGYIVIEPDNCTIIEYSWSVDYPFFKGETNYYNGPLQYYLKDNEMFQHSRTGDFIDVDSYKEIRLSYENKKII